MFWLEREQRRREGVINNVVSDGGSFEELLQQKRGHL